MTVVASPSSSSIHVLVIFCYSFLLVTGLLHPVGCSNPVRHQRHRNNHTHQSEEMVSCGVIYWIFTNIMLCSLHSIIFVKGCFQSRWPQTRIVSSCICKLILGSVISCYPFVLAFKIILIDINKTRTTNKPLEFSQLFIVTKGSQSVSSSFRLLLSFDCCCGATLAGMTASICTSSQEGFPFLLHIKYKRITIYTPMSIRDQLQTNFK